MLRKTKFGFESCKCFVDSLLKVQLSNHDALRGRGLVSEDILILLLRAYSTSQHQICPLTPCMHDLSLPGFDTGYASYGLVCQEETSFFIYSLPPLHIVNKKKSLYLLSYMQFT